MQKQITHCRLAPSLGEGFAGTPENAWGTLPYNPEMDIDKPCVFFGLYGLPDFYALWRHKGKKYILWCGSDIRHFIAGYHLEETGRIKLPSHQIARWINEKCDSFVENQVEYEALKKLGIHSTIVPSFLGNVDEYQVNYKWDEKPMVYTSVSGDDFELYGWDMIPALAKANPNIDFFLYGNTKEFKSTAHNICIKGRVPQKEMDEETRGMQGALRLTKFEGFSEIIAKSFLWGQWPISLIQYPHTIQPKDIGTLFAKKEPNKKGREWLLKNVNRFPWHTNVKNN